jgi:hypothetical protein
MTELALLITYDLPLLHMVPVEGSSASINTSHTRLVGQVPHVCICLGSGNATRSLGWPIGHAACSLQLTRQ